MGASFTKAGASLNSSPGRGLHHSEHSASIQLSLQIVVRLNWIGEVKGLASSLFLWGRRRSIKSG